VCRRHRDAIGLTKLMRFPRVKANGQGFYHCLSKKNALKI
jgi:hypothetical protein